MKWNYFLSHAHEDKALVASPIAHALKLYDFDVWYDDFTLSLGDPLLQSIDNGLASSEYGIVVLSPNFLSKKWTQREIAGLLSKERDDKKVILPIWHNITVNDLVEKSPILADRIGVSTEKGTQYVVEKIVEATYPNLRHKVRNNLFEMPDNKTIDIVRQQLKKLIEKQDSFNDIKLLITAHQWLLKNFNASEGNLIASHQVGAEGLCDFIVVREHGITGPMEIRLIKLGSPHISKDKLNDYLEIETNLIKKKLGKIRNFEERGSNDYIGKPYVGEFESVYNIAKNICKIVNNQIDIRNRNFHWEKPQVWSFRIMYIAGRRDADTVNDRDEIATGQAIGLGIASYDRFFDDSEKWNSFF